jgi:hypothetical protein
MSSEGVGLLAQNPLCGTVVQVRRLLALLVSVTVLAACSGSPEPGEASLVVESAPKRVLVLGNSIARLIGIGVEAALEQYGVETRNEADIELASWGEVSPLMDQKAEYKELVREFDPDVVLITTVFEYPIMDCHASSGDVGACQETALRAANVFLANDLIDVLSAGGAKVVWMRYPVAGDFYMARADIAVRALDILEEELKKIAEKDKRFATIYYDDVLHNVGEEFSLWFEKTDGYHQVRAFDGLHLCPYGTELAAEYVARSIYPGWEDVDPSWRTGEWRKDDLFYLRTYKGTPQCSDGPQPEATPSPLVQPNGSMP